MKDFTTGHEGKLILNFAAPMLLGNVFMQLYQFADTIIVGRTLGKTALAAVGATTPIIFMVISLVMGIGIGSSVVISQYFGAKQYDKVRAAADTAFVFLLAAGAAISLLGYLFGRNLLELIHPPENILPLATEYLRIYFLGSVLLFGYNAVSGILRGVGDSKTPLYFLIVSAVLNVVLDLLFILRFGWGVAGAAWATVIAQGVSFLSCVIYVNRKQAIIRIHLLRARFDRTIFGQCLKLGLPTGLQQTFVGAGHAAVMSIVGGFGEDVIAAYTAANRIDMFASLPIMNFSAALTSFVGQNISVGKFGRIRRGLQSTLLMSLVSLVLINVTIIIFAGPLVGLFAPDATHADYAEMIRYGRQCLVIMNSFYFVFAIMFTFNGLLRGAGEAMVPMLTTMLSLWVVRVPVAALFSKWFGASGIWWAVPIGWVLGAVVTIIYYYTGRWKTKAVVFKGD
jgi:putative MATE family efflux protein